MAMTDAERLAYGRGYNRGARWPAHRPPHPPEPHVAKLMEAVQKLRDAVDGELAQLDADDPWQKSLGDPMDAVDAAMSEISRWLKSN